MTRMQAGEKQVGGREVIQFDDLNPYLLLKNGNYLYKIPFRGGWAVLKVYYGSRSNWVRLTKSFNNVVLLGQTSYFPQTRRRVERECLELWDKHGFKVFDWYDDVDVIAPNCPPNGYLLCGHVDAPTLEDHLVDESIDIETRFETYHRFLKEWCRRHDIAERENEPRLMHENGDFGHVMLVGDDFLWFDLEMVYRSRRRVAEFLWHEIIQYLWYILRKAPESVKSRIVEETVAGYPNRERLKRAPDYFLKHPRLLMRFGRKLDSMKKKGRKPTSKYNVSRRLREAIHSIS
ncbi:MAG: hypothetical protein P1V97_10165 [Planctomycetota bacterium]|nr:hypothetical protein [Planctomycetota bacterium]